MLETFGSPGATAWEVPGTRSGWGLPDLRVGYLGASAPTRCPDLTVLYMGRELSDDAATGPAWIAVVVPQALEVPDAPEPPATGSDAEGTAVDHPDLRRLLERYPLSALRAMGAQMTARDAGLATTATALAAWHDRWRPSAVQRVGRLMGGCERAEGHHKIGGLEHTYDPSCLDELAAWWATTHGKDRTQPPPGISKEGTQW